MFGDGGGAAPKEVIPVLVAKWLGGVMPQDVRDAPADDVHRILAVMRAEAADSKRRRGA